MPRGKAAIAVGQLISRDHVFALFGGVGGPTIVKAPVLLKHFNSDGLFYFANFTGAQPQRESRPTREGGIQRARLLSRGN